MSQSRPDSNSTLVRSKMHSIETIVTSLQNFSVELRLRYPLQKVGWFRATLGCEIDGRHLATLELRGPQDSIRYFRHSRNASWRRRLSLLRKQTILYLFLFNRTTPSVVAAAWTHSILFFYCRRYLDDPLATDHSACAPRSAHLPTFTCLSHHSF